MRPPIRPQVLQQLTSTVSFTNALVEDLVNWRLSLLDQLVKAQPENDTNRLRGAVGAVDDLIALLQPAQRPPTPQPQR